MKLQNLQIGQSYIVQDCHLTDEIRKHLAHLGLNLGVEIRIISKTKANAIFQIRSSRIALDQGIIEALVLVEKPMNDETISLSDLAVGTTGIVTEIWAIGELRRRLMDMGITKNTQVYLKKVAPLGDPIEITLRGYELTLRKSEAQMIGVRSTNEVTE